jgi:hypothetical protein
MILRLPSTGSLLGSLLDNLGASFVEPSADATVGDVSEPHLLEALDALERGDIEYVVLEHGDEFVQAAGAGDGAYVLQAGSAATEARFEVPGGVDGPTLRRALVGYRRGDPQWRGALIWQKTTG